MLTAYDLSTAYETMSLPVNVVHQQIEVWTISSAHQHKQSKQTAMTFTWINSSDMLEFFARDKFSENS